MQKNITKKRRRSITDQLDIKSIPKITKPIIKIKEILKHPITKVLIIGASIYGFLYISKHFINGYTELVKATRNLKNARRN